MKITLVQPRKPDDNSDGHEHWELSRPTSLFYLSSYLEGHTHHQVEIVDLEKRSYRNVPLSSVLPQGSVQAFGITATTYSRFEAIEIARYLKQANPGSWVIVGGVHFMYCAEDTLQHVREIDVVVRGEGEVTLVELLDVIENNRSLEVVAGITYRNGGQIVRNPDRELFEDLDNIPSYTKFTWDEYPEYLFGYPERVRAVSVLSSRGCPYTCVFCAKAGMKYRLRTPSLVVDEIAGLRDRFNIRGVNFLDLTFTSNPHHVRALCEEMIARKVGLKWWCESRANIQLDLLDLMKQAGCVSLVVGVESGSPRILSTISKGVTVDQVLSFCIRCHELGLLVQPYFMFSHPGETQEDVNQTLRLMAQLERFTERCSFQPAMIFPGTKLEQIARSKGVLPADFSWITPYRSELNLALGQVPNIPLYLESLSPKTMRSCVAERRLSAAVGSAVKTGTAGLLWKGVGCLLGRRRLPSYALSPRFYYHCLLGKLERRKRRR